jgi:hypothetical protein
MCGGANYEKEKVKCRNYSAWPETQNTSQNLDQILIRIQTAQFYVHQYKERSEWNPDKSAYPGILLGIGCDDRGIDQHHIPDHHHENEGGQLPCSDAALLKHNVLSFFLSSRQVCQKLIYRFIDPDDEIKWAGEFPQVRCKYAEKRSHEQQNTVNYGFFPFLATY